MPITLDNPTPAQTPAPPSLGEIYQTLKTSGLGAVFAEFDLQNETYSKQQKIAGESSGGGGGGGGIMGGGGLRTPREIATQPSARAGTNVVAWATYVNVNEYGGHGGMSVIPVEYRVVPVSVVSATIRDIGVGSLKPPNWTPPFTASTPGYVVGPPRTVRVNYPGMRGTALAVTLIPGGVVNLSTGGAVPAVKDSVRQCSRRIDSDNVLFWLESAEKDNPAANADIHIASVAAQALITTI